MSLLQPMIDKLFNSRNSVMIDRTRNPDVDILEVLAVGLFTIRDTPQILVFVKDGEVPYEFTGSFAHDPRFRGGTMMQVVEPAQNCYNCFRTGMTGDAKTADNIFSALISGAFDPSVVRLLEFEAVKTIYPIIDIHDVREAFDGVQNFIDGKGGIHHPRMLINLRTNPEGRRRQPEEEHPEFGNVLVWSGSDHNIYWATSGKSRMGVVLSAVGSAHDYNTFLQWTREFHYRDWKVGAVFPMPYHLPKIEPKPEPKPQPDNSVFYLNVMQHLANAEPGKIDDAIMGLLMVAANKHLAPVPERDRSEEYELLAGDTILEYSAGKTPTVIKALNEVKTLITAAFVKKSNEERK